MFVIFLLSSCVFSVLFFFFFKQKTAYEMRISDWSSDVCSSDLLPTIRRTMTDPTADDQSLMAPLRQALLDCAAAGATITYQELAQRASFPGPHTIHRLTLLLEAMARADHAAGRPLLAALAVSRTQTGPDGGGIPGRGFFQLLTELGRSDRTTT